MWGLEVAVLPYAMVLTSLLLPMLMSGLARRLARGRVQLHPEHEHATVLAARYVVFSLLVCLVVPALLQATVLGAAWGPAVLLGMATVGPIAMWSRPGEGRDPDMEAWVHLLFGGLTGTLLLASVALFVRIGGLSLGWLETAPGPGLGLVVLANTFVQCVAYVFFCAPDLRAAVPAEGPPMPALPAWVPGNDDEPAVRQALEAHGLGRDELC